MKLKLMSRYYRMRPITSPGYEDEPLEFDLEKTALVVMHIWNIGMEGGPKIDHDYAVGMCYPQNFVEGDRIVKQIIVPAMDVARNIGLPVARVTNLTVAMKDERARVDEDAATGGEEALVPGSQTIEPAVPGWAAYIHQRSHGDYLNNPPYCEMNEAEIVEPLPGEIYVHQSDQFDRALRRRGIENLIYTGFATDMCILRAPGGAEPMLARGYRVYLMRDATLGVEYPDTFDKKLMTFWGERYFETHCGNTFTSDEFLRACAQIK